MSSMTWNSTGPFVESSFNPSCSCNASKSRIVASRTSGPPWRQSGALHYNSRVNTSQFDAKSDAVDHWTPESHWCADCWHWVVDCEQVL